MILRQTTVTFLVDRVVKTNVGNRRNRNTRLVNIRIAKHRVERGRAAATPTPNPDAGRIDKWPLRNHTRRRGLIAGVHDAHLAIDDLAPRAAARRGRAAIVDTHD